MQKWQMHVFVIIWQEKNTSNPEEGNIVAVEV
jgi:hypothetical protein